MTVPDQPLLPVLSRADPKQLVLNERVVNDGFWRKIRATIGKVPFIEDAVAAYYCAIDRQTPRHVRAVIFGALAYFVMPADLIPDFIAGLGFTDDATVLMAAVTTIRGHLKPAHWVQAKAFLMRDNARADQIQS